MGFADAVGVSVGGVLDTEGVSRHGHDGTGVKVLAIGSEGNVGAPLVEYLRSCGHEVFGTDIKPGYRPEYAMADINHPVDLLDAFDWGPDVVYLMAAVVSRVTSEQAGSLAIATNLGGANNMIQLTKRVGAKLVFFSTSEVYGPTEGIMDEDSTIPRPNNRYGLTKYLGEQIVDYEVRTYGLRAVTVRPLRASCCISKGCTFSPWRTHSS